MTTITEYLDDYIITLEHANKLLLDDRECRILGIPPLQVTDYEKGTILLFAGGQLTDEIEGDCIVSDSPVKEQSTSHLEWVEGRVRSLRRLGESVALIIAP